MSSWSAGASAGLLEHTRSRGVHGLGQTCGVAQYSSWLEGHAFSLVLEGLVHERRQVSLAEAREDSLQPQRRRTSE